MEAPLTAARGSWRGYRATGARITRMLRQFPASEVRRKAKWLFACLLALLREFEFEPVLARVGGIDVERPWNSVLSLGERKLLAFARVVLTTPCLVFLEKPDTGVAAESLRRLLEWFAAHSVSVMAVGRPADARHFYNGVLKLEEDGGWQWRPIPAATA